MLKPKRIRHRKSEPGFRKVQRAVAIHCLYELLAAGAALEEACKLVATLLRRGGLSIGGRRGTPYWQTIRSWRYDTTRRAPDDQEADAVATFRRECRISRGMPVGEVKRLISESLVTFLKAWSPGLG
jgi:hypothetical protein